MRSGYVMRRYLHRLLPDQVPVFAYAADGAEMGKLMVAEGLGITVLPDFSIIGDPLERAGSITWRPLADDATSVQLVMHRLRSGSPPRGVGDLHRMFVQRAKVLRAARAVPPGQGGLPGWRHGAAALIGGQREPVPGRELLLPLADKRDDLLAEVRQILLVVQEAALDQVDSGRVQSLDLRRDLLRGTDHVRPEPVVLLDEVGPLRVSPHPDSVRRGLAGAGLHLLLERIDRLPVG